MSKANFAAVMAEVFRHEGGFVNHPRDPGGATNLGITIGTLRDWRGKPVTVDDVRALTRAEAEQIYRSRFWQPVAGDQLPDGLDLVAMDGGVNSGTARGIRWLQVGLGVPADGVMGPVTIGAAQKADAVPVIKRACAARMSFLRALRHWDAFGRGWSRRVASVEAVAIRMATQAAHAPARPTLLATKAEAEAKATRDTATATGGAGAGGGVAVLGDLPDWGLWLLGAVVVVIVLRGMAARSHEMARAQALQAEAEGVAK